MDEADDREVCNHDERLMFDPEDRRCSYLGSLGRRTGKKRSKPSKADLGVQQSDGVSVFSANGLGTDLGVLVEPVITVSVESKLHSEFVNDVSV
jgi:hypothetical protein